MRTLALVTASGAALLTAGAPAPAPLAVAGEPGPAPAAPAPSGIWDYAKPGIRCGGVVAVARGEKAEYAVVGDVGPERVIGEASYATAESLGVDPDPSSGGAPSDVTCILFKAPGCHRSRTTRQPCVRGGSRPRSPCAGAGGCPAENRRTEGCSAEIRRTGAYA
ncbi:glycoside hydrolase family 75 protein [Streptomyces sp. SID9727]|uniref:glycoside hydrolase family 75 protein n=1 Tax=Streptomyces sp. SID9727 TaxID=2706114 RepID=UPI001EF36BD8|nr:glycoside hydrolase family 75 protein [Streptomyces sp. SID9727]